MRYRLRKAQRITDALTQVLDYRIINIYTQKVTVMDILITPLLIILVSILVSILFLIKWKNEKRVLKQKEQLDKAKQRAAERKLNRR